VAPAGKGDQAVALAADEVRQAPGGEVGGAALDRSRQLLERRRPARRVPAGGEHGPRRGIGEHDLDAPQGGEARRQPGQQPRRVGQRRGRGQLGIEIEDDLPARGGTGRIGRDRPGGHHLAGLAVDEQLEVTGAPRAPQLLEPPRRRHLDQHSGLADVDRLGMARRLRRLRRVGGVGRRAGGKEGIDTGGGEQQP